MVVVYHILTFSRTALRDNLTIYDIHDYDAFPPCILSLIVIIIFTFVKLI